jgi:hypothetical protein
VEPAVEVVAKRAGAQDAEAVFPSEVIDLNYNVTHFLKAEIGKAVLGKAEIGKVESRNQKTNAETLKR